MAFVNHCARAQQRDTSSIHYCRYFHMVLNYSGNLNCCVYFAQSAAWKTEEAIPASGEFPSEVQGWQSVPFQTASLQKKLQLWELSDSSWSARIKVQAPNYLWPRVCLFVCLHVCVCVYTWIYSCSFWSIHLFFPPLHFKAILIPQPF